MTPNPTLIEQERPRCKMPDCDEPVYQLGVCSHHWEWLNGREPAATLQGSAALPSEAMIEAKLAVANWQKYNGEQGDEIVYQAEKMASAIEKLLRATTPTAPIESLGASVPDQALAVPATPLRVDGPSGFDPSRLLMDELDKGIVNLEAMLNGTETGDTFWHRYWAGYLRGYEGLRDKLRTAIATEARRAATTKIDAVHEGAGPEDIAHD